MNEKNTNQPIRLIISNGKFLSEDGCKDKSDFFPEKNVQLELFPNSKRKDVFIVFVQPTDLNFKEVLDEIKKDNIRMVLDIRESPFLNFKNTSRDFFLSCLHNSSIEYLNIHKFMRSLQAETVKDFFLKMEIEKDNDVETAKDGLVKAVKKGPLVVFSDTSPKKDNLVSSFQKELMQSDVKYSAYFMS